MPNPGAIFFKAILALALAAAAFQYARQSAAVEVTVISGGGLHRTAVQAGDPTYRDELAAARKKSMPFYAGSLLLGLIGISMIRKSFRVARKQREARRPELPRPY